jgi:tRNA/tmRNA/rRNA uracil-C5-methylase (TrmA/RlmC/RlmD family)
MRHNQYYTLAQSEIAHERINECGQIVIEEIKRRNIDIKVLKYLLIRYSYFEDKCIAVLYVTDQAFSKFIINHPILKGWKIIYSEPKSPTTVSTKELLNTGENHLVEQIRDLKLKYHFGSFFQINPPSFMHVLRHVLKHVPVTKRLVDLYAGVGTIGLSLASMFDEVILAESDEEATRSARQNIKDNNILNAKVYTGESEKLDLSKIIWRSDTLIVDPPRSGLHPKALVQILKIKPKNFIYVSCNPLTQARDFKEIKKIYKTVHWKLFDLYPQTPHCESVIIMKRKLWR